MVKLSWKSRNISSRFVNLAIGLHFCCPRNTILPTAPGNTKTNWFTATRPRSHRSAAEIRQGYKLFNWSHAALTETTSNRKKIGGQIGGKLIITKQVWSHLHLHYAHAFWNYFSFHFPQKENIYLLKTLNCTLYTLPLLAGYSSL